MFAKRTVALSARKADTCLCAGTLEMEMLASTFIDAGKLKNMTREEMQEYDMVCLLFMPLQV